MWNLVQLCVSILDLDYAAFARERVRRYEALVEHMDFDQTLHDASMLNLHRGDEGATTS